MDEDTPTEETAPLGGGDIAPGTPITNPND